VNLHIVLLCKEEYMFQIPNYQTESEPDILLVYDKAIEYAEFALLT
jgi:hypothetical protein